MRYLCLKKESRERSSIHVVAHTLFKYNFEFRTYVVGFIVWYCTYSQIKIQLLPSLHVFV